jgi:hypothetical protein
LGTGFIQNANKPLAGHGFALGSFELHKQQNDQPNQTSVSVVKCFVAHAHKTFWHKFTDSLL